VAAWEPDVLGRSPDEPQPETPAPSAEEAAAERREEEAAVLQARIDEAYQSGYEAGMAEGRAAEEQRVASAVEACEAVMAQVQDDAPGWLENLEKNLVGLSTAIAREVIGRELKGNAEEITALVREAVNEFPITTSLRVRLNPADLTAISTPRSSDGVEAGPDVRWIPDPSIAVGGCVVEGPDAIVDGRVEKALDMIYSKLIYG
jgi:flagellar assembly protein FliH